MDSRDGNGGKGSGKKTQKLSVMEFRSMFKEWWPSLCGSSENKTEGIDGPWSSKSTLAQAFPWSHVEMLGLYHFKTMFQNVILYAIYWVQISAMFTFQSSAICSLLNFLVISPMAFLCQHSVYTEGVGDLEGGNFFNLCILDKLYADVNVSLAFLMANVPIPYPGH